MIRLPDVKRIIIQALEESSQMIEQPTGAQSLQIIVKFRPSGTAYRCLVNMQAEFDVKNGLDKG